MDTVIKPGDLEVLRDLVNSIKIKITAIEEYLEKRANDAEYLERKARRRHGR